MSPKAPFRMRRDWVRGWLIGGLLTVATGCVLLQRIGDGLARFSYDFPLRFQKGVPEELVMVYVDAAVKRSLQQPTGQPLNRRFHARLLERLHEDGAKVVLYDLLFDEASTEAPADEEFAAAIRRNGRVVLATDYGVQLQRNYLFDGP